MRRGLLIVGHGSTETPTSSSPYWFHANSIRQLGLFDRVECCFWKEFPSLSDAPILMRKMDVIYVVPAFISEGYFTKQLIPRKLNINSSTSSKWIYCPPIGSHPSMTNLLLKQAQELSPFPSETTLVIIGHGTPKNKNSRQAVESQVEKLRHLAPEFHEILPAFMEEEPYISEWNKWTSSKYVTCIPFFITNGLHSKIDIPQLLKKANAKDREILYSEAIGCHPEIAKIILELIPNFDSSAGQKPSLPKNETPPVLDFPILLGEVEISRLENFWQIRPITQNSKQGVFSSPEKLREFLRLTQSGKYRPLPTAPNLRTDWIFQTNHFNLLLEAIHAIYPVALDKLLHPIPPIPLEKTLARRETSFEPNTKTLRDKIQQFCSKHCLCTRIWEYEENSSTSKQIKGPQPLLCQEVCQFALSNLSKHNHSSM